MVGNFTRAFAEHLGVALRTVAKWESPGAETQPRPDTQAILDTALARGDDAAHARFEAVLFPERKSARPANYETWSEDIERAVVCISRQNFPFASTLLNRWLASHDPHRLDDKGTAPLARFWRGRCPSGCRPGWSPRSSGSNTLVKTNLALPV